MSKKKKKKKEKNPKKQNRNNVNDAKNICQKYKLSKILKMLYTNQF